MDDSQITGATSSYARKYCLNGLFCIDDNKDADAQPNPEKTTITKQHAIELESLLEKTGTDTAAFLKYAEADIVDNIHPSKFAPLKSMLLAKQKKVAA